MLFAIPARKAEPATLAPLAKPRIVYGEPAPRSQPDAFPLYLAIETGDTLASLFVDGGLEAGEAHQLSLEFGKWADLRRLRPGDLVRFLRNSAGAIQEVQLRITGWGDVRAERGDSGSFAVRANQPAERRVETIISVPLESSLWEAVERSGESPQQVVPQLADMFQWDVDLFQIDRGDWVSFVVDRRYVGDDLVGYGPIRAALFHHQGETYEAFRHETPLGAGYYTRTGTPVRKQFLRAPLKFTRITSGFSHRRYHPILRRFRPHYGVDYGAPVGTPVLATAEGVIVFAGYESGEGKHIRIRHNSRMETGYLHLSRFAKGIRKGVKVQQGEVIGYVGMTGLSTGPHLDYRVSDNGKYLNPLQLRSITPDALRGEALRRFKQAVAVNLPKLSVGDTLVAEKTEEPTPALF